MFPLVRGNAKAVADLVDLHIHFVATAGLEAVGEVVVFPELLVCGTALHFLFQSLHAKLYLQHLSIGRAQNIFHPIARRKLRNLGNQANALCRVNKHFTVIIVHFTGEDPQQRGLSAAVSAQNGHPLPFLDLKRKTLQEVFTNDKEFC